MASILPKSIERVIEALGRLPGIGPKSAARLTFYLLNRSDQDISEFSSALLALKADIVRCRLCNNFTISSEKKLCDLCQNPERSNDEICVVEEPLDVVAVERTGQYTGRYHVLGGAISPIDGIGPENLKIKELLERCRAGERQPKELILATNPSLEGEATAIYIRQRIEELGLDQIKVTRIARGLPVGSEVEYADEVTLGRAIEGRREL